jgi:hypothetical protein
LIALANYFDSKRTRLHGRADEPEDALRGAMSLEARYFGEGMVRRFLKTLGVFPPGTTVELSSSDPAIVTRANPADPWRPQVKILRGPSAGRIIELRDVNPVEGRHRYSIVSAMAPPLLVLEDAVIAAPLSVAPPVEEEEVIVVPQKEIAPVEVAAKDAHDRARAQLGGMDAILDALLTVPTDALVSAMPPAPSNLPRAISTSVPVVNPQPPSLSSAPAPARTASARPAPMTSPLPTATARPMSVPPVPPIPMPPMPSRASSPSQ